MEGKIDSQSYFFSAGFWGLFCVLEKAQVPMYCCVLLRPQGLNVNLIALCPAKKACKAFAALPATFLKTKQKVILGALNTRTPSRQSAK